MSRRERIRLLLFWCSVAAMAITLVTLWSRVSPLIARADFGMILLAVGSTLPLGVMAALGWQRCLAAVGVQIGAGSAIYLWFFGSVARYLPGGIWGYANRAALATRHEVPMASAATSMYLETLLIAASSFAAGLPALILMRGQSVSLTMAQALPIWVLLCVLLHPAGLRLLHRLPGRIGAWLAAVPIPGAAVMLKLCGFYLFYWIACGVVFVTLATAFIPDAWHHFAYLAASFSLGYWLGLIAFFVPGGIGVREGALCLLLAAVMPMEAAVAIAFASRIAFIVAEVVTLAATACVRRFSPAS